jgi:hypothetical protein
MCLPKIWSAHTIVVAHAKSQPSDRVLKTAPLLKEAGLKTLVADFVALLMTPVFYVSVSR